MQSASEKLMDMLDLKIKMSSKEAKKLALKGKLPRNVEVGGNLDLEGTNITSLPEGLSVGGYLNLKFTKITSLPAGLSVGGYLDLVGTKITSIPSDLSVGGNLYGCSYLGGKIFKYQKGMRIVLLKMDNDPHPVEVGAKGTIIRVSEFGSGKAQLSVAWDNGRSLAVLIPEDEIKVINE